jgi:hypothetical protein
MRSFEIDDLADRPQGASAFARCAVGSKVRHRPARIDAQDLRYAQ